MLRVFVTRPLEKLRQYAYYQSEVPRLFAVKELEYVRASMVQTFERLEFEKKALYRLARVDELSGLANRNHLTERLNWLIAEAERRKTEFALLFLDLDNFKNINDSLGHNVGDDLLRSVAGIIQETLRTNDIVARVGGDEFVIILSHYKSHIELSQIIDRIILKIKKIHVVKTHPVKISASVGVAFYPKDGIDYNSLMKNADIAMYEAKKSGRGRFKFFTEELHQQILKEIELDRDMQSAMNNHEFALYYQPKIDVKTRKVSGAEALIRWIHPKKGIVGPSYFIPAAERNGFIVELGQWVVREAAHQQVLWKKTEYVI
jgi:diguanylate cyclase (GGDEF)-like protein